MKKLILFLLAVAASLILAQAQSGELKGIVRDNVNEPIPFANVAVYHGNQLITGGVANMDGEYSIRPITPGIYTIEISSIAYRKKRNEQVQIDSGKTTFLNESLVRSLGEIICCFQEDNHSYRTIYHQRVAHGNARVIAGIRKHAIKGKAKKIKQ